MLITQMQSLSTLLITSSFMLNLHMHTEKCLYLFARMITMIHKVMYKGQSYLGIIDVIYSKIVCKYLIILPKLSLYKVNTCYMLLWAYGKAMLICDYEMYGDDDDCS